MKAILFGALACVAAGGWAYYTFSTHATPHGQPPLAVVESASRVVQTFNDNAQQYRLLALLSPT